VQNKRKKWKKYIYCKSPQNKELYDEAKEDSSRKVRQAQVRYEKEICRKAKDDPKVFWRFVQSKTKIKESIQCIIDDNGEIQTENKCKAELLNAFFQSVFTNEPEKDIIPTFNSRTDLKLDNIKFEVDTVKKHLQKINETKSQGSDSIHPELLKETIESITTPVAKIFNKSMEDSKLPHRWKSAQYNPHPQKRSKTYSIKLQTNQSNINTM
jgi:hypothetical protein